MEEKDIRGKEEEKLQERLSDECGNVSSLIYGKTKEILMEFGQNPFAQRLIEHVISNSNLYGFKVSAAGDLTVKQNLFCLEQKQNGNVEAQKEIGKLIKRLHDMQKAEKTAQRRAEEAEKQVAKLREVDEKRQC